MPSPTKRSVLETLLKKRLAQLSRAFGIEASSTWSKGDHVDALVKASTVKLPALIDELTLDELRDLCRAHGLDEGGRAKAELAARLLGSSSTAAPGPKREPKQIELPTAVPSTASTAVTVRRFGSFSEITSFLWSVADLLRGDYKQADYGKVVLPMTVLRRLDCVLAPTKDKVLAKHAALQGGSVKNLEPVLNRIAGLPFHNVSPFDFGKLLGDLEHIAANVKSYINGFSESVREVFLERFKLTEQLEKLDQSNLLYQIVKKFAEVDLHPDHVSNHDMGLVYEELIRRFAELSNETAGEHFTPREVIRLMVDLLFDQDADVLRSNRPIRTLFDPACGTGGMLSVAAEYVRELNPDAELQVFGQELNDESFAICKSDMMIKGSNPEHIVRGNSFSEDGHQGRRFDYMLSNPPFGVEWKKVEKVITAEHARGDAGRFGPGLPRISDGSLLFLLHMVSKMKPESEGSRIAIVFNGSPLFTGDAGSGESDIRKWLIERDMLEAIIGLPDQLFYNTGISTYVWLVTNRKAEDRKGKVQLVDGTKMFQKMRKSLGNKRNEIGEEHRREIVRLYHERVEGKCSKIFDNEDFGFQKITVERPLRLCFAVSEERIGRLVEDGGFARLASSKKKGKAGEVEIEEGKALQEQVLAVLRGMDQAAVWKSREGFEEALGKALEAAGVKLPAAVRKVVVRALGERDETAEPCRGADGSVEPDPELRDTENVPLKESIAEYFEREVRPHVPDAWVDEGKTKVGYEISFTRHFYEYVAPRGVREIEEEIRGLEEEIRGMLEEVLPKSTNRNMPMKDSGVEWLGEIPAHWTTCPLMHLTPAERRIMYGIVLPGPNVEEGPLIVKGGDVKPGRLHPSRLCRTTYEIESAYVRSRLLAGDLVYAIRGGFGDVEIVPPSIEGANLTQDVARISPVPGVDSRWLVFVLRASPVFAQLDSRSLGATVRGINIRDLKRAQVPVPPSEERDAIALFLGSRISKIDQLEDQMQQALARLESVRNSVCEAVAHQTGRRPSNLIANWLRA